MPGHSLKTAAIVALLACAACSPGAMIDKMASAEDKKLAFDLTDMLCRGDKAGLEPRFHPDAWKNSVEALDQVAQHCPDGGGQKRLMGYQWSSNKSTSGSSSEKFMVVATESPGKWTMTRFSLASRDGAPEKVVQWEISSSKEKPEDLAALDEFEALVPTLRLVGLGALLLIIGGIVWIVRYNRRKRAERG
jgi:hypothetical protein